MSKQKEIREGVAKKIPCENYEGECGTCTGRDNDKVDCGVQLEIADKILEYLDKQGVVIRKPMGDTAQFVKCNDGYYNVVAEFEPLIKEE